MSWRSGGSGLYAYWDGSMMALGNCFPEPVPSSPIIIAVDATRVMHN